MPLVAAAVVPHSPVLIPTVAGEHAGLLDRTRQSVSEIAAEFYARQVETILIITPHGPVLGDRPTLNLAGDFRGRLIEFGDDQTSLTATGAVKSAQDIKLQAERQGQTIASVTTNLLDYGSTVPLTFFLPALPTVTILPITIVQQEPATLIHFGRILEEFFHEQSTRFGLLASADLVRRSDDASPRPVQIERTIGQAIGQVDPGPLLSLLPQSDICGFAPIVAFLSCLQPLARRGITRSFQAALKVGLMVATIEV